MATKGRYLASMASSLAQSIELQAELSRVKKVKHYIVRTGASRAVSRT